MSYISAQITKDKSAVIVWERIDGRRIKKIYDTPLYFYVENKKGDAESIFGDKLTRHDFTSQSEFYSTKEDLKSRGLKLFESDIQPAYKILSEFYYDKPTIRLNKSFYDIENDYDPKRGYATIDNPYAPINAISLYHEYSNRSLVMIVPPKNDNWDRKELEEIAAKENCELYIYKTEKELLLKFLDEIENSDVVSGWNSAMFDDPYTYERMKIVLGKTKADRLSFDEAKVPFYKEVYNEKFKTFENRINISGRVFVDYMEIYKKFQPGEKESFSLDAISNDELPHIPKIELEHSLHHVYNNDFKEFVKYSIRDTEILSGLEKKLGYVELAIQMAHLNTAQIDDVLGTTKLTDMAILNYCHYIVNKKVPDLKQPDESLDKFKGAFVLPTVKGLHKMIASVDVTSLYPSTMRTLNVSPEMLIGQFYDKHIAYEHIINKNDAELTVLYENGMSETKTAKEWYYYLKEANWNLSGYGTIFDRKKQGIIPSILSKWFDERKQYKALMGKYAEEQKAFSADSKEYKELEEKIKYYDRLQNIKKLSLNSTYGACGNKFFRYFDIRLAESTTRSGQAVLNHMIRIIALKLDGKYEYPSESVLFGDTDSCYFKTHAIDTEEALTIARAIQKVINKEFEKFVTENFLVDESSKGLIKVEQEIVSDYGIAVAKKNYILHLNYKDGKPVDSIKITGLQIKKSNIPKVIGKQLTKFVETLLRGKTVKDFSQGLVDYRDELKTSDIFRIGLPKGVNNVESYSERFYAKEDKLRVPGHVSAGILWNRLLEEYKDTESPKIVSGMKIKVFYLRKKIHDFKSIAVPSDIQKLPDWFVVEIENLIDREQQVIRLVDKPLGAILKAIGEKIPTKQSILIDEEFE